MDYPETLVTFGTQDTGRRQIKHKNTTHQTKKTSKQTLPKHCIKSNGMLVYENRIQKSEKIFTAHGPSEHTTIVPKSLKMTQYK